MKTLIMAAALFTPAFAAASPAAVATDTVAKITIDYLRVDDKPANGDQGALQRVCVDLSSTDGKVFTCTQPFAAGNELVTEIVDAHKKAPGMKLPVRGELKNGEFTIDQLAGAIDAANTDATATVVDTKAAPQATEETAQASQEVCTVEASVLLQETRTKESGEAYIARFLKLTNLRLPGSSNVNKSINLGYTEVKDSKAIYSIKGNYKQDSSKQIQLTAEAPSNKFQGDFLPETLTVVITNDADGAVAKSYTCKVQTVKPPVQVESIPALATGVQ